MYKLIGSTILLTVLFTNINAQTTGGANAATTATATVVAPISITKLTDISFGNLSVHATNAGTLILTPAAARSVTGGVTISGITPGTITAGTFTVTGLSGYGYTVTLPTTVTLTRPVGLETMTATGFTSNPSGGAGTLTGGTQALSVGATLNVAGGQVAGIYTSTNFDVTVNYN